jgi:hypothetical protein
MNGIAVAMREGVEGRLSFSGPACRTSILALSAKGSPDCLPSRYAAQPRDTYHHIGPTWTFHCHPREPAVMSSPLEGCVGSLRSSMQLLDSSINILAEGVNDFPRLAKVLQTTRVSRLQRSYINQSC